MPSTDLHANTTNVIDVTCCLNESNQAIVSWADRAVNIFSHVQAAMNSMSSFIPFGKTKTINLILQKDVVDQLFWNQMPSALFYNVYDSNLTLLYQGAALNFDVHGAKNKSRVYYLSWTGSEGESNLVPINF